MITHHCAGCGKPDKTPDLYTPPGWVTVVVVGQPDHYLCMDCYKAALVAEMQEAMAAHG